MGLGASAVNVTEMQEIPEDVEVSAEHEVQEIEDRGEAEETEEIADGLQGLEDEIEVMAAELEQAAQEGCDAEELDALEEQLDGAVEALVTLREARTQIATMRKDRGFKGPGLSVNKPGASRDRPKPNKTTGTCFTCGQKGHWKGDPQCPWSTFEIYIIPFLFWEVVICFETETKTSWRSPHLWGERGDLLAGSHVMFGTDEKEVFEVNTIEHECMVTSRLSEVWRP